MPASRTKPKLGKPEPREVHSNSDDSMGCVIIPLGIVLSYFLGTAIVRYTSGSGSRLDEIICYGALIVFIIIMLLGAVNMIKESLAADEAKRQWKNTCSFSDVVIVDRHGYSGRSYEDEYGIPNRSRLRYRLTLRIPDQTGVNVEVSEIVYKKLANRRTVRIYYKPEEPLTFLLEEEM